MWYSGVPALSDSPDLVTSDLNDRTTQDPPPPAAGPAPATVSLDLLFLAFFFLSGLSGLVYEVLWTRLLTRHLGNTTYSVSTVLVAFMGGLALGSWLAGRMRPGRRWLAVYGLLEFSIGVYCLALPSLVDLTRLPLGALYDSLLDQPLAYTLLRFTLAAAVLLVPTTLMGATLPVLARHFVTDEATFARRLGRLYAVNTFGAVAGALLCGFCLIPELGQTGANLTAAAINLLIGSAAAALGTRIAPAAPAAAPSVGPASAPAAPPPARGPLRALLAAVCLSGAASMIYQVVWNRILTSFIGSSTYAFALLVSAFILGLALGSAALARWADRCADPAAGFGRLQALIAAAALAVTLSLGFLPGAFESLIVANADSFASLHAAEFAALFALFLVPTFAMGVTFPLGARTYARAGLGPGRSVGDVYALNTVGAIAGSFLGGFVLIPALGLRQAVTFAVGVNLAAGALCAAAAGAAGTARLRPFALAAAGIACAAWLPGWARETVDQAAYHAAARRRDLVGDKSHVLQPETVKTADELLYYEEGVTATVSVHRHEHRVVSLRINGKADASTASDMPTQLLCGHIPMLVAPKTDRVLLIGLGSGVSLGAVTRYPVQRVDAVELCPEVVEATREHFAAFNHDACRDPRVRMIVNDGRNHTALTRARYDVITSVPTNIWIAGVASLFTREFFAECRERLDESGVMAQWVQVYGLSVPDLRSIVAAFRSVFPGCTLWELRPGGDYLLIGCRGSLGLSFDRVRERFRLPAVTEDLARMKLRDPYDVLGYVSLGPRQVAELAGAAPANDDDSARIEFSAPRSLYVPTRLPQMDALRPLRVNPALALAEPGARGDPWAAQLDRLTRVFEGRRHTCAALYDWAQQKFDEAFVELEAALTQNPSDPQALDRIVNMWVANALHLVNVENRAEDARELVTRCLRLDPEAWELWNALGVVHIRRGDGSQAAAAFERAAKLAPWAPEVWMNRGVLAAGRDLAEAERCYREALKLNPELVPGHHYLGQLLAARGKLGEAAEELEAALTADPDAAEVHSELASLYMKMRPARPELARPHVDAAERLQRKR